MLVEEIKYIEDLKRYGSKMQLTTMKRLMVELGNPETKFKAIHIAGTNGKGSTAAMLDSVLREAEYKTGLYTSPYIETFNERIKVEGFDIQGTRLLELIRRVRFAVEEIQREERDFQPTFFEFVTAVAFLQFAESDLDIAVVETGMGGLLDATNVLPVPEVALITNIGLDHMHILGRTKKEIAARKIGIVKRGGRFVTGETNENILGFFRKKCGSLDATMRMARSYAGEVGLLGEHQKKNAGVAAGVVGELRRRGWDISDAALANGLACVQWPGRLEQVSNEPLILVDGAHNNDGVRALEAHLQAQGLLRGRVLILAMKENKKPEVMLKRIGRRFETIIVTEGSFQPMGVEKLAQQVEMVCSQARVIREPSVSRAVEMGRAMLDQDDFMLVTGSLYMIGQALRSLR